MQGIIDVSQPLQSPHDLDHVLSDIADARIVLLGEASHGTSEYYSWRAELSKRLIQEKGFNFIAVEGDWPDLYAVNQYVKGKGAVQSPQDVLSVFKRWPTWMWANKEFGAMVAWLRKHNDALSLEADKKVGVFGLDVYSLWESLSIVTNYLEKNYPALVEQAQKAYQCFLPYHANLQAYAQATALVPENCTEEVVELLMRIQRNRHSLTEKGTDQETYFNLEQNALVAKNADAYYRTMLYGGSTSWNVRDIHMMETLERLLEHHGPKAKAVIWAHNTHVGDARATDMSKVSMINIGQLARERHNERGVFIVGFGAYQGSVIAGRAWDAPYEIMPVPQSQPDSWEDVLNTALDKDSLLCLTNCSADSTLFQTRGNRAIGVVYNPEHELGNYVPTKLADRYDSFVFLKDTKALQPYAIQFVEDEDLPETYPTGF